ncbi:MAG: NYN domain-containing protein, partial [Candidatus Limnocylindrales bacterium]
MQRVAVFIDWQNVYHCAREAFHDPLNDPSRYGSVRPRDFAQLLVEKGPAGRTLTHIGIYRGQPDPRRDPRTHAAHMRQRQAWEADCGGLLRLRTRALRYLSGRPPMEASEKGIDVQLAIDAMLMAVA